MEPIPKSGLYYPNKIARIAIQALEDVMGKNGLNAILNLANLTELIDHYPPNNLDRQFDFADFSAMVGALEEMYGPRGGGAWRCVQVGLLLPKVCAILVRWQASATWHLRSCRSQPSCALVCRRWPRSSVKPATSIPPVLIGTIILSIPSTAARYAGGAVPTNRPVLLLPGCCRKV
jgi:hypothetical protein